MIASPDQNVPRESLKGLGKAEPIQHTWTQVGYDLRILRKDRRWQPSYP